jgi:hypothetical protein
MRTMFCLLAMIIGCESGQQPCDAPECRREAVLQAWESDPEVGLVRLLALPNEVEITAAASKIMTSYPDTVHTLCDKLQAGPTRRWCTHIKNRPHLKGAERRFADPGWQLSKHVEDKPELLPSLGAVVPDPEHCDDQPDRHSCIRDVALANAKLGDAQAASANCEALELRGTPPERWRWDCNFMAAEQVIRHHSYGKYDQAVALCGKAGSYLVACLRHLQGLMARDAPAADEAHPEGWAKLGAAADTVGQHWSGTTFGAALVDGFWAVSISMSMHSAESPSGDLLEHVPEAAVPHVRAAAAYRVLLDPKAAEQDLDGLVRMSAAVMDKRHKATPRGSRHEDHRIAPVKWSRREGARAGMAMVQYRGMGVRVVADVPQVDLALCVLEAAARLEPVRTDLLNQGLAHKDARVRWTAEQLLSSGNAKPKGKGVTR